MNTLALVRLQVENRMKRKEERGWDAYRAIPALRSGEEGEINRVGAGHADQKNDGSRDQQ